MFRRQAPRACLIMIFAAAALAAAAPAMSQDASTGERLDRVERDLNMLQRQVYGGAPPPPVGGAAAGTGGAVDVEVRMERIEQQMRDLTGRVEEVGNRVEQLRQRIEQIDSDVAMRLGGAPAAPNPDSAVAPPPGAPPGPPALPSGRPDLAGLPPGPPPPGAPRDSEAPTAPVAPPAPSDGPTPIFGTLQPPVLAGIPPAKPEGGGAPPAGSSPDTEYDYAFGLVKKADYPAAETALKAFVQHHPTDRLAGSAQYWLGETYYQRGRYLEAASAFAEGYKRYPKGPKAPDDLLKLGMSLARADQTQNACLAFGQLQQEFPRPGAAVKERVVAERRRLHC
jgi:tol-pal system protein YbgF